MARTHPIPLRVRNLGQRDYEPVWHAMQAFTDNRTSNTLDEIWLVEHAAVFTQGQAGRSEHLLDPGNIPVIQVDRGGQVTYHGPGQLIAYILIDLHRAGFGIKRLVSQIENSLIALLSDFNITAETRTGAPGVYVDNCKIAALGLRVRKGRTFHGLSLNVDMNLEPFSRINPCGFPGLVVTQIADIRPDTALDTVPERLLHHLSTSLGYTLLSDYADDLPT